MAVIGRLLAGLAPSRGWFGLRRAQPAQAGQAGALLQAGNALMTQGRAAEALGHFERLVGIAPEHADGHYNRGVALQTLARYDQAVAAYDRALQLDPKDREAHNNRGISLMQLQRRDAAAASFAQALQLAPDWPDALHNQALALLELRRPVEAADALGRLLRAAPDYAYARGKLLHTRMQMCDWRDHAAQLDAIEREVAAGQPAIEPFALLGLSDDRGLQRRCAEIYARHLQLPRPVPLAAPPSRVPRRHADGRIRIGYVGGEFRQQATAVLIAELIERHDRGRFEVVAFDNGWDDGSAMRRRLVAGFDAMLPIHAMDDDAAAAAVAARGIDILVDLNGYFGRQRRGLFARRSAPLQVNYLGFPGTLGAPDLDYLIADATVLPPEHADGATECVVWLPHSYQPNDRRRVIDAVEPDRAALGLPDAGFVFCCFNNNFKITPAVFDVWMRLLRQVDGSVLWLLQDNPAASDNLRREALARGVAAERLVFAARVDLARHLARHRAADLLLDTLPCNAHTTASDALWAGLPLLTCLGGAFAGRVAASLLKAVGLPELVTTSLPEYEALALALAREPHRLNALRERLARQREHAPLFDSARYTRDLETAYATMHDRAQRGLAAASFAVDPIA